jgi:MoaA/NifB/PqqE/SkfB family radical SAM enzyme
MESDSRMESDSFNFPFLSNIGLMLTYRCSIACPHCIVEAGPHRKEEMLPENAYNWIDQAGAYREHHIKGLALTGGEPFYHLESLKKIAAYGRERGFLVSVVTNAFWATSKEDSLSLLSAIPGIQMISFSTDVYHQKFIPFEHIKNAVCAAKELGIFTNVAVCTPNLEDIEYKKIMGDLSEIIGESNIKTSITFPVGRAKRKIETFDYRTSTEPLAAACSMASFPTIFPDGKVIACVGPVIKLDPPHPFFLGDLNKSSLTEILNRAEINPILHAIRIWGPHRILSFLKDRGFSELLPKEYIADCICDACFKLMADEKLIEPMKMLAEDDNFIDKVAYARLYYLQETKMLEMCQR